MIMHELGKLFSWKSLLIVLAVAVPLALLVFVSPKIEPAAPPTDRASADAALTELPEVFSKLQNTSAAVDELTNTWVNFGGIKDEAASTGGAWEILYNTRIDGHDPAPWNAAFAAAKTSFNIFYSRYQNYFFPRPALWVPKVTRNTVTGRNVSYDAFIQGIEQLYTYLNKEYNNNTDAMNDAKYAMIQVRTNIPFRKILENSHNMSLTETQAAELNNQLSELNTRRQAVTDDKYYVDFSNMTLTYIMWHLNDYVQKNIGSEIEFSDFYGFTGSGQKTSDAEYARAKWFLDNGKFSIDYSAPPTGLSVPATFSIMHALTGTSFVDFVYNAADIICPFLLLLAAVMTMYLIFEDIYNDTILGSIASRQTRRKIIWSKLFACFVGTALLMTVFGAITFGIFSVFVGGITYPPTVLLIIGGKTLTLPSWYYLLIQVAAILIKMLAVIALTALLSVLVTNKKAIYISACALPIFIFILSTFLSFIPMFVPIFCLVLAVAAIILFYITDTVFSKKEFL